MQINDLSYRQKNKLLLVAALLLFVICWYFSFSRSYREVVDHYQLENTLTGGIDDELEAHAIKRKHQRLDSLLSKMTVDSLAFEDYFLQSVSYQMMDLPVSMSYDGKGTQMVGSTIMTKDIVLKGDYHAVLQAISNIEKRYFISRFRYAKQGYILSLAVVIK